MSHSTFAHHATVAILASLSVCAVGCGKKSVVGIPEPTARLVDRQPAWSPDGNMIAYTHAAQTAAEALDGVEQIWFLDVRTRQKHFAAIGSQPAWSPDGTRLAFVRNRKLHVMEVSVLAPTPIAGVTDCFGPSWSPDGTRIAFASSYGDPRGRVIWVIRADGSDLRDISAHGTGEWLEPAWSPNGSQILHIRYLAGVHGAELFVMDTTGANPSRLTTNSDPDADPSWSPDGNEIARTVTRSDAAIWIMNVDGSNDREIARGGSDPTWSPDGQQIAFKKMDPSTNAITLWRMERTGANQTQLTSVASVKF